ncbi:hypothetical protein BV22DRAFT_923632 [Leucogyrophana mollusca]|uniref:Uncharacterized protein n=1 Tax=Leucogyrophana mollusca TaxID=85980 RepID=A0ACB8AZR2_9AGAM|nr:hypothetical protein BV22DRAFT_923632 [Leucogyrophana mollusca]
MTSSQSPSQELAEMETLKGELTLLAYLTLAGITVLLWDTLLTIQLEIQYIWRKAPWGVQLAFGLNRYGMGLLLAEMLWTSVPLQRLDTPMLPSCHIHSSVFNLRRRYHGERVFMLWDRSPRIMKLLLIGAAITFACSALFSVLICVQQSKSLEWDATVTSCVLTGYSPYYTAMWTTQALFEVYAACLIFFNTLNIPRTSDWQIWNMLYNDGIIIVIITFGMSLTYSYHSTGLNSCSIAHPEHRNQFLEKPCGHPHWRIVRSLGMLRHFSPIMKPSTPQRRLRYDIHTEFPIGPQTLPATREKTMAVSCNIDGTTVGVPRCFARSRF